MPALTNKSKLVTAVVVSTMVAAIAVPVMAAMYSYCWYYNCMWEEGKLQKGTQPSTVAARRRSTTASSSSDYIVGP